VGSSIHPVILYDGVCALCNRAVRFVLKHDHCDHFRFAALQSETAHRLLRPHLVDLYLVDLSQLNTVCVLLNPGQPMEKLLTQSHATIAVLAQLGGIWSVFSSMLRVIPRPIRDWAYRLIATHRYQIFGKYEACPIPAPKDAHRFLV
jgi:predicted DCC family thiol-disulfide oxidoreductase YuxK